MLKKKIPAIIQPNGQSMKAMRINPLEIHMTPNRGFLEVNLKKFGSRIPKKIRFEIPKCSLGQFGNDVETALMNPEKIDLFCSRYHICNSENSVTVEKLEKEKERLEAKVNRLIRKLRETVDEIKKQKGEVPLKLEEIIEEISDGREKDPVKD